MNIDAVIDDLVGRVVRHMDERGMSANQLAGAAGVAEGSVRDIRKPDWRCGLNVARKLESYLANPDQEAA